MSFAIVGQRFAKPTITYGVGKFKTTFNMTRLGSVAYRITEFHGCVPRNSTTYLEKGARSDVFRTIQTVQINCSAVVFIILLCAFKGKHSEVQKVVFAPCTILISFPLLVYEAVIATKGRPVVMSGNCMLVELDPRLGFLDSQIDNWWKTLVGITGL